MFWLGSSRIRASKKMCIEFQFELLLVVLLELLLLRKCTQHSNQLITSFFSQTGIKSIMISVTHKWHDEYFLQIATPFLNFQTAVHCQYVVRKAYCGLVWRLLTAIVRIVLKKKTTRIQTLIPTPNQICSPKPIRGKPKQLELFQIARRLYAVLLDS